MHCSLCYFKDYTYIKYTNNNDLINKYQIVLILFFYYVYECIIIKILYCFFFNYYFLNIIYLYILYYYLNLIFLGPGFRRNNNSNNIIIIIFFVDKINYDEIGSSVIFVCIKAHITQYSVLRFLGDFHSTPACEASP